MKPSPFILSAILHLVIGSAIWHYSGNKPVPRPPIFYVELAGIDASLAQPISPAPQAEPPRELTGHEPAQPEPAVSEQEVAQSDPTASEQEVAQAAPGEPSEVPAEPQQAQVAPEISRAFAGAWHAQEMMYNTRRYLQVAGMAMREVLEGKLSSAEREHLNGAKVQIFASYDNDAAPAFSVKTESEELRALLRDETAWARVPSPKECKVQYKKVAFLVSLERGSIQVGLSPQ